MLLIIAITPIVAWHISSHIHNVQRRRLMEQAQAEYAAHPYIRIEKVEA